MLNTETLGLEVHHLLTGALLSADLHLGEKEAEQLCKLLLIIQVLLSQIPLLDLNLLRLILRLEILEYFSIKLLLHLYLLELSEGSLRGLVTMSNFGHTEGNSQRLLLKRGAENKKEGLPDCAAVPVSLIAGI